MDPDDHTDPGTESGRPGNQSVLTPYALVASHVRRSPGALNSVRLKVRLP